jgi:hypothetical protein
MGQRQADALAALDVATNDRLNAISVATQQGIINLYQVGVTYACSTLTHTVAGWRQSAVVNSNLVCGCVSVKKTAGDSWV